MGLILVVFFVDVFLLFIFIVYYCYDRFLVKRWKDVVFEVDIFLVIFYSIFFLLLILFFGKVVVVCFFKGLVLNSIVFFLMVFFDMILYRVVFLQRSILFYFFFLILIFVGVGYLVYYYVVVWFEEVCCKKKLEIVISFDRKFDDFGFDQFDGFWDVIIQIYKNVVLWFEVFGILYQESWMYWEYVEYVNYMRNFYFEFVRFFEKVKYVFVKIGWEDVERVFEIYFWLRGKVYEFVGVN